MSTLPRKKLNSLQKDSLLLFILATYLAHLHFYCFCRTQQYFYLYCFGVYFHKYHLVPFYSTIKFSSTCRRSMITSNVYLIYYNNVFNVIYLVRYYEVNFVPFYTLWTFSSTLTISLTYTQWLSGGITSLTVIEHHRTIKKSIQKASMCCNGEKLMDQNVLSRKDERKICKCFNL